MNYYKLIVIPLLETLPIIVVVALMFWRLRALNADERREGLTTQLLNLPGASLQKQRDEMFMRVLERMFQAVIIGTSAAAILLAQANSTSQTGWSWLESLVVLAIFGAGMFYGLKITRDFPKMRRLRHALRAEQATAQEMGAALAGDNRLIHDVQAGDFNIDHVAITPAGIFAVETKSRLKPPAGNGSPRVRYDGKTLDFGTWQETKPIEQASRQARWLEDYLRRSTGEALSVTPVLALPGWYVEPTTRPTEGMVRVINPKNSNWLFLPQRQPAQLDAAAIQRAAFQIEKLAQARQEQASSR